MLTESPMRQAELFIVEHELTCLMGHGSDLGLDLSEMTDDAVTLTTTCRKCGAFVRERIDRQAFIEYSNGWPEAIRAAFAKARRRVVQ